MADFYFLVDASAVLNDMKDKITVVKDFDVAELFEYNGYTYVKAGNTSDPGHHTCDKKYMYRVCLEYGVDDEGEHLRMDRVFGYNYFEKVRKKLIKDGCINPRLLLCSRNG